MYFEAFAGPHTKPMWDRLFVCLEIVHQLPTLNHSIKRFVEL